MEKQSNRVRCMKHFRSLGTILSIATALVLQVHAQSWLTNGLVAFYPFNGNANDLIGTNSGTPYGAALTTDRFATPDSAYAFNGFNSTISFQQVPLTQVDNWTMSAWINPASLDQIGMVASVGYDDGVTGDGFAFGIGGAEAPGSNLSGLFGGVSFLGSGYTFTAAGQWQHVAMVRTNGITRFFVNAVLTPNIVFLTPKPPTAFTVGSQNGVRFFNGLIDDLRIYNRALSPREVHELYQYERNPLPSLAIAVKTIRLSLFVQPGTTNQVESSTDLLTWLPYGPPISATNSVMYQDVDILDGQQYFLIRMVQ
jgi:hypothetical protein